MGDLNYGQMQTELRRRISQLNVEAAGNAINRAIRWINRQGSFSFQLSGAELLSVTNDGLSEGGDEVVSGVRVEAPRTMDMGKAHFIRHEGTGLPVKKVGVQDLWMDQGYDFPDSMLNVISSYAIQNRNFFFRRLPPSTQSLSIQFHKLTTDLGNVGDFSNLPRDFDDLVIDLAEAEERRIYDVGEVWVPLLARCQDQIRVLLDGYRSVSFEPMQGTEAVTSATEKTQTGQA